jgi:hypothetical protein
VIGVLRVNGALPVRAFSMRPNLEAPGHDTEYERAGLTIVVGGVGNYIRTTYTPSQSLGLLLAFGVWRNQGHSA